MNKFNCVRIISAALLSVSCVFSLSLTHASTYRVDYVSNRNQGNDNRHNDNRHNDNRHNDNRHYNNVSYRSNIGYQGHSGYQGHDYNRNHNYGSNFLGATLGVLAGAVIVDSLARSITYDAPYYTPYYRTYPSYPSYPSVSNETVISSGESYVPNYPDPSNRSRSGVIESPPEIQQKQDCYYPGPPVAYGPCPVQSPANVYVPNNRSYYEERVVAPNVVYVAPYVPYVSSYLYYPRHRIIYGRHY